MGICLFCGSGCATLMAQEGGQGRNDVRMTEMLEKRAERLADDLKLKKEARTEFLETYKQYQQELMKHRRMPSFPAEGEGKKESDMTDEEAVARVKAEFDRKAQEVVNAYNAFEVDKKYYELFSKTMTAKQLMKIFAPVRERRERGQAGQGGARMRPRQGNFGGGFPQGGFDMGSDW